VNDHLPRAEAYERVAIADRSGFDESVHHGAIVALGSDGTVAGAVGDPDLLIYPRSSNKPLQTDAMLRLGLQLQPEELALACASHDGTDRHVTVARRILAGVGLGDEALANTPDLPQDRGVAERVLMEGGGRAAIYMNCSGKHAAMLATCRTNDWDVAGYLDVSHPLQLAITARIADLAGGVEHIGVDGCGAPAHVVTLTGLARAFRTLAMDRSEVWAAMTAHPELVGGEHRDVTRLMWLVPALMAKDGAEGVFAAALPDGRAVAVKIADGGSRAAGVVMAAALAGIGVDVDPVNLGELIRGHGRPVGRIRPAFEADW
jgi:L-asparaginase II